MNTIERIIYDESGRIASYVLSNGVVVGRDKAFEMAKAGMISGVITGVDEIGEYVVHKLF